ncbi:hypothetical protein MAC_09560 [Metarhizium acridum CQMa 102]|uniref:Uncharacterized protein n=1 Tax=Metarhizium acridum (strain CQMa 102) TaxID=655827 RepID=E9EI62_METAQ|nr:uncharacterized protein MAC_09560 [Metarhizium acridum CQMa 102]EFY84408.1 hypothetical protein MAC_09560 [Metarhizium acridum CQMa 102]
MIVLAGIQPTPLNRQQTDQVRAQPAEQSLRISSYNTAGNPPSIRNTDTDIRKANLYEPATLNDSYSGAEVLFLVSFPSMEEEPGASRRTAMSSTPQGPSAYKTSFTHRFRSANAPRELPALRK